MNDGGRLTKLELQRMCGHLRAALVSDALDALGLRQQCLGVGLAQLRPGRVLVGHAFPARVVAVDALPAIPYTGLLAALDAISPGEVFVASARPDAHVAIWGELVSTACMQRGAVGAVCNGYARDTTVVRTLEFPVFCRGAAPYDINGRGEIAEHGHPVDFNGVRVEPGDLVVGDDDGVMSVPLGVVREVIARALEKGRNEGRFRAAVRGGMSASAAFAEHGVL